MQNGFFKYILGLRNEQKKSRRDHDLYDCIIENAL